MKKLILYILLIFVELELFSTNYYIKNGGNDALSGTSDANAWANISKINSSTFSGGDTIFFKRGDEWIVTTTGLKPLSSGSSGLPIVFSAYGTGSKPIISGYKKYSGWKVKKTNVYYITGAYQSGFFCVIDGIWATKASTYATLDAQDKWYEVVSAPTGGTNDSLYIYTTTASDTSNVVFTQCLYPIEISSKNYITIEKLDIKYSGSALILSATSTNIKIDSCRGHWAGNIGFWASTNSTYNTISNNIIDSCANDAIYFGPYAHYSDASYNVISNCGLGTAGDRQAIGGWYINNFNLHHNNITHNGYGTVIEISSSVGTHIQDNVNIYNNIIITSVATGKTVLNIWAGDFDVYNNIINMTGTTSTSQAIYSGEGTEVRAYHNVIVGAGRGAYIRGTTPSVGTSLFTFKNNIFYNIQAYYYRVLSYLVDYFISDYNIYNDDTGSKFEYSGVNYNFTNWKTVSGEDANSFVDDPEFNNLVNPLDTFNIKVTSPAIDAGIGVGIILDYNNAERDILPDIGAYEYGASPPVPPGKPIIITTIPHTGFKKAIVGGNVTDDGGADVTERGICYDTTENPNILDTKISSGTGEGSFSITLSNLILNTVYHIRAYAINSSGTSYGDDISFTCNDYSKLFKGNKQLYSKTGKILIIK